MITHIVIFFITCQLANSNDRKIPYHSSFIPPYIPPQDETTLAIRQGVENFTYAMPLGISDFRELINKSNIFIDNSVVIKELVMKGKQSLILSPNKWGKSIVLTMMQMFLEIQVDENGEKILPIETTTNYRFFNNGTLPHSNDTLETPLLISKHFEFSKTYQGQYPVIYVNFGNISGENITQIVNQIGLAISRAFKQHEYLIKVLQEKADNIIRFSPDFINYDLITFNEFLHNKAQQNISRSLHFLSRILKDRFRNPVFVLMDDYDSPIHNFLQIERYRQKDAKEIISLFESLALNTFKDNDNLCKATITGKFSSGNPWDTYKTFYLPIEIGPLREYFGFTYEDVQLLFRRHDIPSKMWKEAYNWYDGFASRFSTEHFYNPQSIVQFLHNREISCYWNESKHNTRFIHEAIRTKLASGVRKDILCLLSQQAVRVNEKLFLNFDVLTQLRKMYNEEVKLYPDSMWFFSYLLGDGYLVKLSNSDVDQFGLVFAKLPNFEIAHVMANWMISYYLEEHQIQEKFVRNAAITLTDFLRSRGLNKTTHLQESLAEIYKDTASLADKFSNPWDTDSTFLAKEDMAHAVFHCIALQMQCDSKFKIQVFYRRTKRADIVIMDNEVGHGVIAHLMYKTSTPEWALEFAQNCSDIFIEFISVHTIKFVGIHVSSDTRVQVLSKLMKI